MDSNSSPVNLYILARDSNVVSQPVPATSVLLPPATRVELLVVGGKSGTKYNLVSTTPDNVVGNNKIDYQLATVGVEGEKVCYLTTGGDPLDAGDSLCSDKGETFDDYITSQKPAIIDDILPDTEQVAGFNNCQSGKDHSKCIAKQRSFTFNKAQLNSHDKTSSVFTINGKLYDDDRIDTVANLGDIEEWQLVNNSGAAHAFHMHQLDFLVTKVILPTDPGMTYDNYNIVDRKCKENKGIYTCLLEPQGYRDMINLPPNSITTIRIPFLNPFITGVFVYHCHILAHEDRGMMQNLKVIDPKSYKSTSGLVPNS